MNIMPLLAQVNLLEKFWVVAVALIVPIVVIISIVVVLSRYTKVGPNQVLIISGRKHAYRDPDGSEVKRGFRIVKGGGTFVYPVVEKVDILSLELLTIDVQTPEVYTSKGVPVKVDGVAQIKVKGDDISIATAAEQFLGKRTDEIRNIATQTLEGHLRAILGTMTVEDIYQNRDAFASKVQEVAAGDMANMGLGSSASRFATSGMARATSKPSASRASPRSNATPSSLRPKPTATPRSSPRRRHKPGRKPSSPPTPRSPRRNATIRRTWRCIRRR